ncbi:DUF1294 domain-containing protein [Halomonas alkaliantarctica]|uniref:DUF1294 domain-containing protein n=1 Tax=Halomonas alkaliantarctica TaxID=232346 RepID=UPI00265AB569|nr:DUF1294 domain-containing protein [Halomonas alkaliantarctica]
MISLVAASYVMVSVITYGVYAVDKRAAVKRRRRVSEKTLHLMALAGGWPGAWLAQQRLRHKTQKTRFRRLFWVTVVLNAAALSGLLAVMPLG